MIKDNSILLKEIISFIENIYGYIGPIDENTIVEDDLKITGDEAVDFLIKYGKFFNVDVSNFYADKYFKGEGEDWDIISRILEDFGWSKKTETRKIFTVGDMIKGIKAGKLNEEVLAKGNTD